MARVHRKPGARLFACAIAALFVGSAISFVAPRPRVDTRAPSVSREFFKTSQEPAASRAAEYEEETLGDKIKAAWKNDSLQKFIAFVATASTAMDVLGLFTGEASVTAGIGEALASLDTSVALQEGQSAAEALADAAQSADLGESTESITDLMQK
ncbi:BBR [Symbiodinium natans]|uniref:BBR protein n=1 Tax=Symbiodinium natans TaxID=878477 RepID=A0A812RL73_9DINO|nr:BBR [Symbiodinium natans]